MGNLTQVTEPAPEGGTHLTTYARYDIAGNVLSAHDDYGHSVSSSFSSATQYAAPDAIAPNGNDDLSTNYGYNSFLGLTSVDTADTSASMTYDVVGRPSTATSPYGAVTYYTYSSSNPNLIVTTTGTRVVNTNLDGLGRTIKVETGDSSGTKSVVETQYDSCACSPLGKVKQVSQPHAPNDPVYWTVYGYDALGRTTTITLPDGSVSSYSYSGNTTTVTDPAGKWKTYTTDAMGNLIQVTEPAPEGGTHLTTYAYNVLNQLTTVTMPRSTGTQTRTFNYDLTDHYPYSIATARLMSVTNPESGTTSFEYNDDGSLFRKTDAKGQKVKFTYDTLGRVTVKQTYKSDGTEDICGKATNYWDTRPSGVGGTGWENVSGRLMAVRWSATSCPGGQFTEGYQYDTGLLTVKRLYAPPLGSNSYIDASFTYTDQGQLQSMAYPVWHGSGTQWPAAGKTFTYGLDSLYRATGLTDEGQSSWVTGVAYGGPSGQMTAMSYGLYNETRAYNARGQLTRLTDDDGNISHKVDLEYRFSSTNNDGRLTQMKDWVANEEVNYQYDSLGRLTLAETTGPQWGQSFSFDGFGNLTAEVATKGTPPTVYRTYDAATNRLTCTGYSYDLNGNLTAMPGLTMTYNVENRMTQAVNTLFVQTENYGYDTGGLRLWKQGPDGVTHVFYNGQDGKPLADFYLVNGSVQGGSPMVYFAGKRVDNSSVEDRLGTGLAENGQQVKFYPYGALRSGTSTEVQYATYKRDSVTNLDYAHQRYYSSQIARFLTPDPDSGSAKPEIPQSFNRYPYVGGDPVNQNDPTGLIGYCDASEDCPILAVRENDSGGGGAFVGDPQAEAEAEYDVSVRETITKANMIQAAMKQVGAVMKDAAAGFAAALLSGLFTPECGADMDALGIEAEDWAAKLTSVSIVPGPGSTDPLAPTWPSGSGQPQPQNIDKMTVGGEFGKLTSALSDPNGPKVYINPIGPGMDPANAQAMAATIAHETLHKLGPGMAVDTDIQGVLGLTVDEHNTQNISDRLAKDCFPMTPSAPILLP